MGTKAGYREVRSLVIEVIVNARATGDDANWLADYRHKAREVYRWMARRIYDVASFHIKVLTDQHASGSRHIETINDGVAAEFVRAHTPVD